MAQQTLSAPLAFPGIVGHAASVPGLAAGDTIDGSGKYTALVLQAREAMSISHINFKLQSAVGSPTADLRVETVSGGAPSGSLWAASTNVVTGALSASPTTVALGAPATIAKGDLFAIKALYNSGTSFALSVTSGFSGVLGLPYRVTNVTGSAVKSVLSGGMTMALGSSLSSFYEVPGLFPALSIAQNAFNNTSSAKRGVRFQVPFKCVAAGFRYVSASATGAFIARIEDVSGAELSGSSTSFGGDSHVATAASQFSFAFFDNDVELLPGVTYRLVIEPSSSTNCSLYTVTLPSSDLRSAWPGGSSWNYSTYTAGGGWDDTVTNQVPLLDLLISAIDYSTGGSARNIIGL